MLHILTDTEVKLENILSQNFEKIVLYFTATWCGPCKTISPVVEELANDSDYKNNTLLCLYYVDLIFLKANKVFLN